MIDLLDLKFRATEPGMPDHSVFQEPILGGVTQKISRIGAGFTINCTLPPEELEPGGRQLIARMMMAKRQGARIRYILPDFKPGVPGHPTVNGAVMGGVSVPITGATPRYEVRIGQPLNLSKADRTYLYFAGARTVLDGAGAGTLTLTTPLRSKLVAGAPVDLSAPVMEGWILGDNFSWPIDELRTVGLSFSFKERA